MAADRLIPAAEPAAPAAPERRRWVFRLALVLLGLGVLLAGVSGVLLSEQLHDYSVNSASMSPTLKPGDTVLAPPVAGTALRRGDLVVVDGSDWGVNGPIVRRVVGIGGDRVTCCAMGRTTVDGKTLVEPYTTSTNGGLPGYSVTVPRGRLFLLGDNRADAIDSRLNLAHEQGTLPLSAVKGRVILSSSGGWTNGGHTSLIGYLRAFGAGVLLFVLGLVMLLAAAVLALVRRARQRQTVSLPG